MSVESVRKFFEDKNVQVPIYELDYSTATVEEAAAAHRVEPALIAKTMAIKLKDRYVLIIMAGDGKLDNRKFKDYFGEKCTMVKFDEVLEITGHPVGGVCAFANPKKLDTYLDEGLKRFEFVFPAAGAPNASLKITPEQMREVTGGKWVDLCKI